MDNEIIYDCAIIGGGLAGLTLSIQLSKAGHKVVIFEKEQYPFHKVCGEYISMESWHFLEDLGLPLRQMNLPLIKKLVVTSPDGNVLKQPLTLGGFGISRYTIDNELMNIAKREGVNVVENCKVEEVIFSNESFALQTTTGTIHSKVCAGTYGKRSNLDIKWKRRFIHKTSNKLNNYIGVKYHIRSAFEQDTIALHNFKDGYCGISKIEEDRYCLCYLTNAANLKRSNNSIAEMEKNILSMNPHLAEIFRNSTRLYSQPLSISQISFQQKELIEDHILMIGDAAGMITPLCGNGMSMAMHGAKIAAGVIDRFLKGNISRAKMEDNYSSAWNKMFSKRLRMGRLIQRLFGKIWMTNMFVRVMKRLPLLTRWLIRQTHGRPF